jgi:hypothetical protein
MQPMTDVLGLVLHTCPWLTARPADACALLSVCTAWRRVLQGGQAWATHVTAIDLRRPATLRACAAWLHWQRALLVALKLDQDLWAQCAAGAAGVTPMGVATTDDSWVAATSTPQMAPGADTHSDPSELLASAAAAGLLRLQHLTTNCLHSAGCLPALLVPAALTSLRLTNVLMQMSAGGCSPGTARSGSIQLRADRSARRPEQAAAPHTGQRAAAWHTRAGGAAGRAGAAGGADPAGAGAREHDARGAGGAATAPARAAAA